MAQKQNDIKKKQPNKHKQDEQRNKFKLPGFKRPVI